MIRQVYSADNQDKGNCRREKDVKIVPTPVINAGGCRKKQILSNIADASRVDANNVSPTVKVKTEANKQIKASTTATANVTITAYI